MRVRFSSDPWTTAAAAASATQELLPDGRHNWFPCQEPDTPFFCKAHRDERADHERAREIARLSDLSQGRELEPIPLEMGYARVDQERPPGAAPGANGRSNHAHNHLHGGGSGGGGEGASQAARAQWDSLLPQVPLPLGVLATGRSIDFVYVESVVGR